MGGQTQVKQTLSHIHSAVMSPLTMARGCHGNVRQLLSLRRLAQQLLHIFELST